MSDLKQLNSQEILKQITLDRGIDLTKTYDEPQEQPVDFFKNFVSSATRRNESLPHNWSQKTFDSLNVSNPELAQLKQNLSSFDFAANEMSLTLSGRSGVGKTHILCALFLKIGFDFYMQNNHSLDGKVLFWTHFDLAMSCRKDAVELSAFENAKRAKFLFLDDLGAEKNSDFSVSLLSGLLDWRIRKGLPTFVTTNLTGEELKRDFGERFTSRLKESGVWVDIKTAGDYRNNKFIERKKQFESQTRGANEKT